jgi:hypothetical protein
VPYTTKVARVNLAVAASLAMAPKPPIVMRAPGARGGARGGATDGANTQAAADSNAGGRGGADATEGGRGGRRGGTDGANADGRGGANGGRRPGPMIARGAGYDAVLSWRAAGPEDNIKGYTIVVRATTAPYWEQEIYVGKVTTFTLKDVSIDDAKFGVKAIGNDGAESLVTPYIYPPRVKTEIETVQ